MCSSDSHLYVSVACIILSEFWNMIPTGSSNQCPAKTLLMSALMPHAKRGKLEIK